MKNSITKKRKSVFVAVGHPDDAIFLAAKFKREVLENRPSIAVMRDDIRMNKLKVRPYAGDLFQLNMSNPKFIATLWGLLKLDEFVLRTEKSLPKAEADLFYTLMLQHRANLQAEISKLDMRMPHLRHKDTEHHIAMEIFREAPKRRKPLVH